MILLDTNTYSMLERGNAEAISVINSSETVALTLTSIAELRYGFKKGSRTTQNELTLTKFLASLEVQVLLPTLETTEHYACLAHHAFRRGRVVSNNDLWIAALAREHDATLVTFDRDFLVFSELLGKGLVVLGQ